MGVGGSSSVQSRYPCMQLLSSGCLEMIVHIGGHILRKQPAEDTTFHAWLKQIFLSNWLEYCTRLERASKVNNNLWRLRFSMYSLGSWLEWRWQRQSQNAQKASLSGRLVEISFFFLKDAILLRSLTVNSSNLGFIAMAHRLMRSMG